MTPPESVGIQFAADVMRRNRQFIFVLRECATSFTVTCFIPDERSNSLREAIVSTCALYCPLDGPPAVIRTDPAPAFVSLSNDHTLDRYRITIEIGRIKNLNKNPVAEKAVQELEHEIACSITHLRPTDRLTASELAVATSSLNSRIRRHGLSVRELWYQRDQFTNDQLPISHYNAFCLKHADRVSNH